MNIGKESETIEFKRSVSETKEGLQSVSAILNKHGKGILYFGIRDNGDVIGQQTGKDTLNKLSRELSANIKPSFYYEINEKNTVEGQSFIEVTFSGEKTPYSAYGRYYLRFHDEDRLMDNDTLRVYYYDQRNDYSQWERNNSFVSIEKVDHDLLMTYLQKAGEKGRLDFHSDNTLMVLKKLGLLYDENTLNNAGNVLFSSDAPVQFKMAVFAGESRLTILDMDIFNGNIYECIKKGLDYFSKNVRWQAVFTGNIRREEIPEIPYAAVREILVNAFCHGDYNSNTDFEMIIYSNRISIYSPGHFPKPYTPEMFAENNLEPIPMNKTINNVLYKDGTIEQFSTGFERAFQECKASGIKYEYMETPNGFRFTFFRPGNEKTQVQLTQTDQMILNHIRENPDTSSGKLGELCGVSERTAQRSIKKLKELGLIDRIGSNKSGIWRFIEN